MTDQQLAAASNMLAMLRDLWDHFGYDYPRWQLLKSVIAEAEDVFPKEWSIHETQKPDDP